MTPEDELKLSFYEEISKVKNSPNVSLVKHIDTGEIFVKKTYEKCPSDVFDVLKSNSFQGVPKIYEYITDPDTGRTTVIKEYINGKSLDTILDIKGKLPEDRVISIAISLCDILAPLHRNEPPLIHRDIKPSNVILTENDDVYLVDFDAARLYDKSAHRDTELLGTEAYAAPEQYGFLQSDPRTDIYALGILIREMLTGSSEKDGRSCGRLNNVVNKCTSMDPDDRFQSTIDLKLDLIKLIVPEKPAPESVHSYALPGFRGNSTLFKVISVILYLLMVLLSFSYSEKGMSPADLWVNRIAILISLFLFVLLFGNYMGISDILPLTSHKNKIVRILGYVLYSFMILFAFGLITNLADAFL